VNIGVVLYPNVLLFIFPFARVVHVAFPASLNAIAAFSFMLVTMAMGVFVRQLSASVPTVPSLKRYLKL